MMSSGSPGSYSSGREGWREAVDTEGVSSYAQKISTLDPVDRLHLLISPSEVFVDPSDQWNLEDLDSRILAFQLFLDPTEEKVEAAENQKRKLAERFDELGWE